MICQGQSVATIVLGWSKIVAPNVWAARLQYAQPRYVLELGTGQGASGACIMAALPRSSRFTTVNYAYPEGYGFGEMLYPWSDDPRLTRVVGDTTNPATLDLVEGDVDLLFMDTTHEAYVANAEFRLWQSRLMDGALVIVDDLQQHDMIHFWGSLPYEKVGGRSQHHPEMISQGIFRYDASKPYMALITERTTDDFAQRYLYIDRQ